MQAPFVAIAHQHGRASAIAAGQVIEDRADLLAAAQAGQVKVHADHPDALSLHHQVGPDRSARLERGERDDARLDHADPAPHQQGIAMPAERIRTVIERNRLPGGVILDRLTREHAFAPADPPVGFLQGDHIGVDLAQHGQDPVGIAAAISPDRLVDVVAGELELHRRRYSPAM